MATPQWTFIGAGNMASSLIGGLIASGVNGENISVVDINGEALERLSQRFGVQTHQTAENIEPGASFVIAVKPHIVETVCVTLSKLQPALVVSVAAGVRTDSMSRWLDSDVPIVRCMPNTPALLGVGATALYASTACNDAHRQQAEQLLSTAGIIEWVSQEEELDAVTALSGSGPAYFFYVIEHMIEAAEASGLSPELARNFAIETAFGAASMARAQEHTPAILRENVTSKGGTTAAALAVFDDQKMNKIIETAMKAAQDRAAELGNEFGA